MRRIVLIGALVVAAVVVVVAVSSARDGEGDGDYVIRAYFDNAGFLVEGEDVRIAGATVGSVKDVAVTLPGEPVRQDGAPAPGKAVATLSISDEGFQDFRVDASCLIRPQSLLGEKYVDCLPTQPRAPGSATPAEIEPIAEGEPGEGEYALPLENNGKAVDLDLVNNITRESETDRFRLIINDLGAALAARGDDLAEVIRRGNPALEQTDEVLGQLAAQNRELARLAADSDRILEPLARERRSLSGFINNAAVAGAATAERREDLVAGLRALPQGLTEVRATMEELRRFAEAGTPLATDLRAAAPGLTGATKALQPFSKATTTALLSLGDAAEEAGPDLAASRSVIRRLGNLAETSLPGARSLDKTLTTLRKTGGIDHLMDFVINTSNVFNGFDQFGHYLRGQIQITNCIDYSISATTGCGANWVDAQTSAAFDGPAPPPTKKTIRNRQAAERATDDMLEFLVKP